MLDTRHFPPDFTDRLLASFDNLDEMTDGLLVHAENWQALNLLQEKYRERVKCIYIDPPYNTGSDEFLYRDNYQHSSWLAMMENRIQLSRMLMSKAASLGISIDDNEVHRLDLLLYDIFGINKIGEMSVTRAEGGGLAKQIVKGHDYLLLYASDLKSFPPLLRPKDIRGEIVEVEGKRYWIETDWLRVEFGKYGTLLYEDIEQVKGAEKKKEIDLGIRSGKFRLIPKGDGHIVGRLRSVDEDGSKFYSVIKFLNSEGVNEVEALFGSVVYDYPKPSGLLKHYILGSTFGSNLGNSMVLDFFAGSGTTGHAVINLNREDGGRRKFILVEMADYFDTVLLPRIKKVTFTPEWKDGKPKRMATPEEAERSPRIVKVIRLESYEDALNNLTFDEESGQKALELFKDDYLLSYMLKWETRHSETLLNVEQLQLPFSYKLRIHRDGETRERPVDLPETFNYLLGLDVQTRKIYLDAGESPALPGKNAGAADVPSAKRRYLVYRGTLRNGRSVVVLWRDTTGWTAEDYVRDATFVAGHKLTEGAEEIYVNGDSRIPGARSLDPIFKERMVATGEA